jgi:lipopolysaccharide transport system permease protein
MLQVARNLIDYQELIRVMAWRSILVRYKQAYLGILWAVLKPVMLLLIFIVVRSFVGIDSGDVPYPLLTFAALLPWILFQESASEGVNSVVGNANLIRKIYFPREIFPITSVVTKLIEFGITLIILAGLMIFYRFTPNVHILWMPLIILYTLLAALTISLAGSALNVYYRDVVSMLPVALSLMMYVSPVMYPLHLVHRKLVVEQAAGDGSNLLYTVYTMNPITGIIDSFQRTVLKGLPPDLSVLLPGMAIVALLLPLSYLYFKRAESYFADVI